MKKLITLAVALIALNSMANVLVYNYKASIARLDVNLRAFRAGSSAINLDTASTRYDSINGYLAVYACSKCNDSQMRASSIQYNEGWIYIKRAGDKVAAKKAPKGWYRAPAQFASAMFGPKAAYYSIDGITIDTRNSSTRAWARLNYSITYPTAIDEETGVEVPAGMKYAGEVYGFLGLGNLDSYFQHAGFGYVTYDPFTTDGACGSTNTDYCWKLYSIYGTLIADCTYAGKCGDYIFDICSLAPVADAVAYGTWTLKLNNALSGAADFTAADAAIAKKIGVQVFFSDYAGTVNEAEAIAEAKEEVLYAKRSEETTVDRNPENGVIEINDASGKTSNGVLWL